MKESILLLGITVHAFAERGATNTLPLYLETANCSPNMPKWLGYGTVNSEAAFLRLFTADLDLLKP